MLFSRSSSHYCCTALLAAFVLASCANQQIASIDIAGVESGKAMLISVDQKRRPLSPDPLKGQALQLWFPAVAGHLFATPNVESSWSAAPDKNGSFVFPLAEMADEMKKMSRAFDASETAVLLEPASTRFARISSYAVREFDGELLGRASWTDPLTRAELILVYFDRSCRMLGSVLHGNEEILVDLQIPAAGLYWLRKHRTLWGTTRLSMTAEPQKLVLTIEPAP